MQLPEEPDNPLQINILPMIDVIFSILAFFIISTLFLTRSEGLPVDLPSAQTAQPQQSAPVNVTVKSDGTLALNQEPVQLQNLGPQVRQLAQPGRRTLAIVNADEGVPHGRVVQVLDRLRQLEGVTLAIAAERAEQNQSQ